MKRRLEIEILNIVRDVDVSDVNMQCCETTIEKLEAYSFSVDTKPALLQKTNRKYKFVGVPLIVNNKILHGMLLIEPSGVFLSLGG